jgi:VacB/RNase II family 3'-5' exoribonuclease
MNAAEEREHRAILQRVARQVMVERGLLPEFSGAVVAEVGRLEAAAGVDGVATRDLRELLWCSIDNDDSRDLDQLTVAAEGKGGETRILVSVADVDALVRDGSAIDAHARHNTTSVYTAAQIFPMLPERLSTDLTSLNPREERLSVVVEMVVGEDGAVRGAEVYRAQVRNQAKLAYNSVAAWLEGGPRPEAVAAVPGLEENLRLQDRVAQSMKELRNAHGALSLQTIETKPVFEGEVLRGLEVEEKNRAKSIIEDFMIAANGVIARYLSSRKLPSIRRVVRVPKRWDRIVEVAEAHGARLPEEPDSAALEAFLRKQKAADPLRFPDLSLSIIKLLGPGEYVADLPGSPMLGHFGLAVRDYTHSTAPNRRYTDLITQRLIKAALDGKASPYSDDELESLARHCTEEEDAANKVERQVAKSAAALLLEDRVGEQFEGLVTGASAKGTWVRLLDPPVEGRLVQGFGGCDVGDRVRVRLVSVEVERGFIDFRRVRG